MTDRHAPGRQRRLVCGLDLGGTKLLGAVVDVNAPVDPTDPHDGIVFSQRVPTPHGGPDQLESVMGELVSQLRGQARREFGEDVEAVGLGAPGLVDRQGVMHTGPHLPGLERFAFADVLAEQTGLPSAVDNDATCAAWAEHERGRSGGHNHTLFLTLGTGIGAGITVKGEVLRGANGFAGEPGHMIIDPTGPRCPCGRRGCWERYASGTGLGRLGREAAVAGRAAQVLELAGGDTDAILGEHVTAAATGGDAEALAIMAEFGRWVALGIANLVAVLDSEVVIIGGGLIEAGSVVMDPIRAAFPSLLFGGAVRPGVPVEAASLGENSGAIGAALLAAQRTGSSTP